MMKPDRKRPRSEIEGEGQEEPKTKIRNKAEKSPDAKSTELKTKHGKSKNIKEKDLKNNSDKTTAPLKKPNWAEIKKKKKELRKSRKESKCSYFTLTHKSKKLWEEIRRSDCPLDKREELTREIYKILKGNLEKMVFSHDLSRVVQWLLKLGPQDIKNNVVDELAPHIPTMLKKKYACCCVQSILTYGSQKSARAVVASLNGKVVKLASHSISAEICGTIYSKWATKSERNMLRQEFYGDMYKTDKETNCQNLKEILELTPNMKDAILSAIKSNLTRILEKKLLKSPLLHSVLFEFLSHCNKEDREEVCKQIQDSLLDFIGSKDGSQIAVLCVCEASSKGKKSIMKSLRSHMLETATSENGYILILALCDVVDDTVLFKKMLMPEITSNLSELASDKHGRKVLLHLVAHRDPLYFTPSEIELLKHVDSVSNSKKDLTTRISEICEAVLTPLLEAIEGDPKTWMSTSSIEMVTLAVFKSGTGPSAERAFGAVSEYICDLSAKITEDEKEMNLVEHPGTHMVLRKLIQNDKERQKKGEVTFSSVLASKMSSDTITSWINYNRGCFLLVLLLESGVEPVVAEVTSKLEDKIGLIKKQSTTGARILHKKLTASS